MELTNPIGDTRRTGPWLPESVTYSPAVSFGVGDVAGGETVRFGTGGPVSQDAFCRAWRVAVMVLRKENGDRNL